MGQTRVSMTTADYSRVSGLTIDDKLASLVECLDSSWFRTRLRARIPDRDRIDAKHRRTVRGVRLAVYWYHRSRQ